MPSSRELMLKSALAESALWGIGSVQHIAPIRGGLTNRSYLIKATDADVVLRINNPQSTLLGLDRAREIAILKLIKPYAFAPKLIYHCPRQQYVITEFIQGDSFKTRPPSLGEKQALNAIITLYQGIACDLPRLHYADLLRGYYRSASSLQVITPEIERQWQAYQIALEGFDAKPWQAVLCHHDINAANIIRSDRGLKVIDWEFANLGHPKLDYMYLESETSIELEQISYWLDVLWTLIRKAI